MQALSTCGIPYSLLDAPEANEKIPQLNIPMEYVCVIEEDGGILRAERALEAFQVHIPSDFMKSLYNILWSK